MKVRTSLFLLSAVFVILIVALGFIMLHTSDLVNREVRGSNTASNIIKDVSELNIVTYEYLLHHEERMHEQWLLKYDSLGKLLEGIRKEEIHPEHLSMLESITSDYESLGDLFSQLQANFAKRKRLIEENRPEAEINLSLALEERITAQALMKSQKITSEVFGLSATVQQRIAQVQQRTNSIVLFSIIGFAIVSFSISFLTTRAITGPLGELVRSAEIIGKGNLKHRVDIKTKNEIGELAAAFDQMTERRQRAEEELKEYSERLEEMVEERTQELQDAQEQLVRREKLAILGQLAGGVGHELRNPLGVISNAVYFLQMTLPDADETTKEYLEIISEEVRNSTKIVSDLLDFSRTRMSEREEIAVSELVAEVLEKHPPPEEVEVVTEIAPDLPPVFVDPRQMGQVLVNLVVNAYQAMKERGALNISAQAEEGQVAISVTDTGCGISEENMAKLFEPLFTTKARGIGLGLAVSRILVEANGGSMEVESEVGQGSTFTVRLPTREVVA
jgi:signal transduction histidine kinase